MNKKLNVNVSCASLGTTPLGRIGGVVWLCAFLFSVLDGGGWSDSLPGRFFHGVRATGAHCWGGYVG